MNVDPEQLEQIADDLYDAYQSANPIDPITANFDVDIGTAYDIQSRFIKRRLPQDGEIIGHKIGLTSQGIQDQLGVNEPDYGVILENMFLDGNTIPTQNLIEPRVEPEIGFILDKELLPPVSYYDVLRATHGVIPLFEVIDSRIKDWEIQIEDTIADNASSAYVITGNQLCDVLDRDLTMEGVRILRNGEVIHQGLGANVLQHPAKSVAWLANKIGEFEDTLSAGELVLSGAPTPAIDIEPGDTLHAEFTSIGAITAKVE